MLGLISGVLLVAAFAAVAVGALVMAVRLHRVSQPSRPEGSPDA